jgi:hypothetical protein
LQIERKQQPENYKLKIQEKTQLLSEEKIFDDLEENWQNFKEIILSAKEDIRNKSKLFERRNKLHVGMKR